MKSLCHIPNALIVLIVCMLFSGSACKNKIGDIQALNYRDTFPLESTHNLEMIYSDSAQVKGMLKSPIAKRYGGEDPYLIMPEGLTVYFFDSLQHVKTSLKAGFAIKHEKSELMEARKDVVVVNHLGEKLNTEHLVWDQSRRIIYSDVFVKITRKDEILYGQGLEADESFDKWVIKKPKGTFYVNVSDKEGEAPKNPE